MKFIINGNEVEVSDESLTTAIENKTESIDVKMEGVTIRTEEEETTFVENTKGLGKVDGIEMGRKNVFKALGIEPEGAHKGDDKAAAALNAWAQGKVTTALTDAKIEPDKKVTELNEQIETLKGTITTTEGERDEALSTHIAFKRGITRDKSIVNNMPDNLKHSKEDMLLIFNNKKKTGFNDSGVLVGFDESGNVMKSSTTGDPLPIKDVVSTFFNNNTQYIKENGGGAGGGDSKGNEGKQTFVEFAAEMRTKNVEMNSVAWNEEVATRQKNGTLES